MFCNLYSMLYIVLSDSLAIRYSETGFWGRGRPRPGRFQAYYRRIRASPLRSRHFICRFGILISGVGGRAGGPRKFGGREILATRSGPLAPGPGGSRKLPGGSRRPPGAGIFPKDSRRLPGGSSPECWCWCSLSPTGAHQSQRFL